MICNKCKKKNAITGYRCIDCMLDKYSAKGPVEFKCFSCKKNFFRDCGKRRFSFCKDCWQKYFTRVSGSELQGMDFTREIVRIRDKHTCQSCLKKWKLGRRRFDIHHLNGMCGKNSRGYDKVADIKGMTTLCHKCHLSLPEVREKMRLGMRTPRRLSTVLA